MTARRAQAATAAAIDRVQATPAETSRDPGGAVDYELGVPLSREVMAERARFYRAALQEQ